LYPNITQKNQPAFESSNPRLESTNAQPNRYVTFEKNSNPRLFSSSGLIPCTSYQYSGKMLIFEVHVEWKTAIFHVLFLFEGNVQPIIKQEIAENI
jgi:hypothetical protein